MKKVLTFAAIALLIFGGAYYVVSTYKVPSPPKNNTSNKTDNEANQKDTSSDEKNNENSSEDATAEDNTEKADLSQGTTTETEKSASNNEQKEVKVAAPDFTLTDTKGNKVTLSELKGKNVFLNFWASWCGPCQEEMPDIEKLYQETKDSDLVILAVNIDGNKAETASFMAKNKYNFTALLDTENIAAVDYQVVSIPTSYFIDKEGYVVSGKVGSMTYEEMKSYVEELNK